MIYSSPFAAIEIPDLSLTEFCLGAETAPGERAALIDGPTGRVLSRHDLDRQSRGFAAGMAARGLGKGDTVCLFLPNLPEYAVVFHGVARAGAINTTANPLYTARELTHQLHDSGAKLLVTIEAFLETATEVATAAGIEQIVLVGGGDGGIDLAEFCGDPAAAPQVAIDPAVDLVVLPYSSGTTGLPKGVKLTHRNLIANILQASSALQPQPGDVLIGVLPFFHIYGMTVIMNLGLHFANPVVSMPRFDLEQFLGLITKHRVTNAYVVPPIALALARQPIVAEHDLTSLRFVMSGAAPLGSELTEQVEARIDRPVIQGYGMTELSPVSHCSPLDQIKHGTIGPPVASTEARIVDPDSGADCERGELWIRGPQVMVGYLNNDRATADTITADGWLRSGDIAIADEDGYFTIVDRLKELIKYKGFQVPPAELEAILLGHPAVADCAVIGIPDEEAGEIPKGFVVIAPGAEDVADGELLAYVAERVSPQKKLRILERTDAIPKSASGKILRRELRSRPATAQPSSQPESADPGN